ncbi:hypothetical protein [Streptomyces sp900116325]|uniref:hypothetical protein n=1 Tax=Streptomyces sp. 900116325 TaxID=3154295 RepID=UPI0033BCAB59
MPSNQPDLHAICDTCLTVIADGDGHIWIDQDLAHKTSRRQRGDDIPWPGSDGTENIAIDGGVPWQTTHTSCAPHKPEWAYAIPVERITTWPALVHWTAHLMNKGWVEVTNWDMFMLQAVEPQRAAVSGLRPVRPQDLEFRGIGS